MDLSDSGIVLFVMMTRNSAQIFLILFFFTRASYSQWFTHVEFSQKKKKTKILLQFYNVTCTCYTVYVDTDLTRCNDYYFWTRKFLSDVRLENYEKKNTFVRSHTIQQSHRFSSDTFGSARAHITRRTATDDRSSASSTVSSWSLTLSRATPPITYRTLDDHPPLIVSSKRKTRRRRHRWVREFNPPPTFTITCNILKFTNIR